MRNAPVETVLAWHAALNSADVERVLSLSTDDVEVGGPRGAGHGADLLRDWVARAGVRLESGRVFVRGEGVVVEQSARWPSPDGKLPDPQTAPSVFRVQNGLVSSTRR